MILGFGLVAVGVFFAVGGLGSASAHGTAIKGVSIQGPSWLILVVLGVGTIVFGAWQFEQKPGDVGAPKEEATVITVAEGRDEPYTYGDSIRLDDLWDSCAEGDWTDCDELYEVSPFGGGGSGVLAELASAIRLLNTPHRAISLRLQSSGSTSKMPSSTMTRPNRPYSVRRTFAGMETNRPPAAFNASDMPTPFVIGWQASARCLRRPSDRSTCP